MKFAICDDEQVAREQMVTLVEDYATERKLEIDYEVFEDYLSLESRVDEFDVFLLDYQMPEVDGLQFARTIRERYSEKKAIIFVTAFSEIVYDAFVVRTHRFLTKPIDRNKFFEALDAYFATNRQTGHLVIQCEGVTTAVDFDEIVYVEVMRKELYIYTEKEQILCRRSITSIEEKLEGCHFFRVHRSYLVNMKKIRSFDNKQIEFVTGETVPVSTRKYADLCKAYLQMQ